jgi:hypothetical protein
MIGADLFRGQYHPFRIVPEGGKVFEDSDKAASSKERTVFDEHVTRLHFSSDSGVFAPQSAPGAFKTCAVSC